VAADGAAGGGATGDTNVVVAGVDEPDVIDRVDGRRALVVAGEGLHLVDLTALATLARVDVPFDARVSFDPDASVAWVVGSPAEGGTEVRRLRVGADALSDEGAWRTSGWLVDARRTGDRLHVVAVEGVAGGIPFTDGPVPCDRVLRPVGPSGPDATLLASFAATGAVEPRAATEVVGGGQLVHVTADAAFVATPVWDDGGPETSIHRFDLATLEHTGSGRVGGTLLGPFSMSVHEDHLRVAVTHGGTMFTDGGRPVDAGGAEVSDGDAAVSTPATDAASPAEPRPPDEPPALPAPARAGEDGEELRNEIVVLDLESDLDVVGRTPRFGHPGETLHGIRFDGPTAYAVTFLQADPFYVVDVADPAAPRIAGEVELPGFSAYLHPVADGLVAGFGPDGEGRAAVKLFDVTDPARPRVVDTQVLGDDSPVVWDHHAYLALDGGAFAVPASTWRPVEPAGCTPAVREQRRAEALGLEREFATAHQAAAADRARLAALQRRLEEIYGDLCVSPPMVADTDVVVAATAGGTIDVGLRLRFSSDAPGTRVLRDGERWVVLAGTRLVGLGADGAEAGVLALA
jgi:uncharacterized secreted protein with C-terminal beta-propeller domain